MSSTANICAERSSASIGRRARRRAWAATPGLLAAAIALLLVSKLLAAADGANEPEAFDDVDRDRIVGLVRVRLPLTGSDDESLQFSLMRTRDRLVAQSRRELNPDRPTLVLKISPGSGAENSGAGSQFERASALATFVGRMSDVKTIAWIPQTIRGHGVLVALACEEIVMAPDAEIGEAGVDETGVVPDSTVQKYREIASDVGVHLDDALAVGMVDASAEVVQLQSEEGVRFLLREEVPAYKDEHEVLEEQTLVTAGSLARFTGREGRELGFVKYVAADQAALAALLKAPMESLEEDESLLSDWQPVVVDVSEPITQRVQERIATLIGQQLERNVNWICLRINSPGGQLTPSTQLASMLAELDPQAVRTVAYVSVEARGGAALAALACDQLVMHPDAKIGVPLNVEAMEQSGPKPPPEGPEDLRRLPPRQPPGAIADDQEQIEPAILEAELTSVRSLATQTDRTGSLYQAVIDPGLALFQYRNRATGEQRLMSIAEAAELADADDWKRGAALQPNNEAFQLTGEQAQQLGVCWRTVDSFDELQRLYGIDQELPVVKPNWALELVQALAAPEIAWFLLLLGFAGLYIELKTPGIGIGAFVAAVAFIMFFWSNFLDGSATWFEVLMFVAGFLFLLVEVFVLPGFGIFGLGGGVLIIFSLILASQRFFIPRTEAQLDELRRSITAVAAAGLGMMALAWATRRYLPQAPLLGRIMLEPPPPEERQLQSSREAVADYAHLVGATGVATTDLRPSGRARFGDEVVDVSADGELLERGARVTVVDAYANRVVVRAYDRA